MGTIKEIKEMYNGMYSDVEIYAFTDNNHKRHNDYIIPLDDVLDNVSENVEACDYTLMDEEEYSETILANCDFTTNFAEWYGDIEAKVLVIFLDEHWEWDCEEDEA